MNRIDNLFKTKNKNILSIYFTAGYPDINSTIGIIGSLASAGAEMIEIGIPFSDPLADGPLIQRSNGTALRNGMSCKLLFEQLAGIRQKVDIPLILMGYINPVLKFGIEKFCNRCNETGIDGLILPDLPPELASVYKELFEDCSLKNILLISPQTPDERIRIIDGLSTGFVYLVSSSSTTGIRSGFSDLQKSYLRRIKGMNLTNPQLTGFGISDSASFHEACLYANGAIIGSAFIRMLSEKGDGPSGIRQFIDEIRGRTRFP